MKIMRRIIFVETSRKQGMPGVPEVLPLFKECFSTGSVCKRPEGTLELSGKGGRIVGNDLSIIIENLMNARA